jgi:hypothetical protein
MSGKRRRAIHLVALLAASIALGRATSAWCQTDATQGVSDFGSNPNAILQIRPVTSIASTYPVRTTATQPLERIVIGDYRGVYCAEQGEVDRDTGDYKSTGGQFDFQRRLLRKLSSLDAAAIRVSLQRAEKGSRAEQFGELFGIPLPPDASIEGVGDSLSYQLNSAEREQLIMGQRWTRTFTTAKGLACLTPAQVDAAIAEAKRVHQAVISAMEGGADKRGPTTTAPSSSGLQTQTPKGK